MSQGVFIYSSNIELLELNMVSEVCVWRYEYELRAQSCRHGLMEYGEIDDFIDRLVGVKHAEIAQSVLRCRIQKISSCTPEGQAVYEWSWLRWRTELSMLFVVYWRCADKMKKSATEICIEELYRRKQLLQWIFC